MLQGRQGPRARRHHRGAHPAAPEIPPLNEAGVPGYDMAAWHMVVTPAKTPPPVVDKLHGE